MSAVSHIEERDRAAHPNTVSDFVCEAFVKIAEKSSPHNRQFICTNCHNKLFRYNCPNFLQEKPCICNSCKGKQFAGVSTIKKTISNDYPNISTSILPSQNILSNANPNIYQQLPISNLLHKPTNTILMKKSLGIEGCPTKIDVNHEKKVGVNFFCVCTCCHRPFKRKLCIEFVKENYYYLSDIISHSLSDDIRYKCTGMLEYICKTCDRQLNKHNTTPIMPCEAVASPKKVFFLSASYVTTMVPEEMPMNLVRAITILLVILFVRLLQK